MKGRVVAVSAWGPGKIRTWDLKTGRKLRTFRGGGDYIQDIAVTTIEGHRVAISGSSDGVVRLWDLASHTVRAFQGHTDRVSAVTSASVNNRLVAVSGDYDGFLRRWDLGSESQPPKNDPVPGSSALTFTRHNGRLGIIAGTEEGSIEIWDLATRTRLRTFMGHTRPVRGMSYVESDGDSILLSCDDYRTLKAWDLANDTELWSRESSSYTSQVSDLAIVPLPHSRMAAAAAFWTHDICVWDISSGDLLDRIDCETSGDLAIAYIDNRPVIIFQESYSGTPPAGIHVWDPVDHTTVHILEECEVASRFVATNIDGRPIIVLVSNNGQIRVRDIMTGDELVTLHGHSDMVSGLAVLNSQSEPVVISTTFSGAVRAWDLSRPEEPFASIELAAPVNALTATPDGSLAAVGTPKGFLVLEIRPREQ